MSTSTTVLASHADGRTSEQPVPVRAHGTVARRREYLADARRACREGRYPTIDDPTR